MLAEFWRCTGLGRRAVPPRGVRERGPSGWIGDLGNRTANTGTRHGAHSPPGNSRHRVLVSEIAPFFCENHKPEWLQLCGTCRINDITSLGTTSFCGVIKWKTSTDEDLNVPTELGMGVLTSTLRGRAASTKTSPGSRCPRGHRAYSLYPSSSLGLPGFGLPLPAVNHGILNTCV